MAIPHHGNRPPHQGGHGGDRTATIQVDDIRFNPIPAQLFGDIAKRVAKTISESGRGNENKPTQLRKFYDELVIWHDKVHHERGQGRAEKYAEIAPFIQMMKAKVAYAQGRQHVDANFERLFSHIIGQIDGVDSLKHAKLFMEAFMGFYKLYKQN
ncbi:MAG: type III-A CRISPR-associated protein Csm2 [Rhodocyclaceae bacterium]|nr:type III-A CRISPR-associated protein Csm2 [Rhodocyclaceae bacterium]